MNKLYLKKIKKMLDENTNYYNLERAGEMFPYIDLNNDIYEKPIEYIDKLLQDKNSMLNRIYLKKIKKILTKNIKPLGWLQPVPYIEIMTKDYYKLMKLIDKLLGGK